LPPSGRLWLLLMLSPSLRSEAPGASPLP
jgi:hypothetical protein